MEIRIRNTGQLMTSDEFNRIICTLPITTEVLNQHNADAVLEGPQPTAGRYQIVARDGVTNIDGAWYTFYKLVDLDDEGKANLDAQTATSARQTRDQKLKETDWRFRTDMNPSQQWKDYCQELRDVPSQVGFPWDIVWPQQP